jgi:hypothetical protein
MLLDNAAQVSATTGIFTVSVITYTLNGIKTIDDMLAAAAKTVLRAVISLVSPSPIAPAFFKLII